jgi:hypothetical protein
MKLFPESELEQYRSKVSHFSDDLEAYLIEFLLVWFQASVPALVSGSVHHQHQTLMCQASSLVHH